jgi:hypothetical protein
MIGLSQRDDPDCVAGILGERHKSEAALSHPDADPSLFTIILSGVRSNENRPTK